MDSRESDRRVRPAPPPPPTPGVKNIGRPTPLNPLPPDAVERENAEMRRALGHVLSISVHDHCPIWLGGALQHIARPFVLETAWEYLTEAEVREIKENGRKIMNGDYSVIDGWS